MAVGVSAPHLGVWVGRGGLCPTLVGLGWLWGSGSYTWGAGLAVAVSAPHLGVWVAPHLGVWVGPTLGGLGWPWGSLPHTCGSGWPHTWGSGVGMGVSAPHLGVPAPHLWVWVGRGGLCPTLGGLGGTWGSLPHTCGSRRPPHPPFFPSGLRENRRPPAAYLVQGAKALTAAFRAWTRREVGGGVN